MINRIGILAILGFIVREVSSLLYDAFRGTKLFLIELKPTYTVGDFVFWIGEPLQAMIWCWAFMLILKGNRFYKLAMLWCIDWQIIDIVYLIFSNPYNLNRSKWETNALSFGLFILQCLIFRKKIFTIKPTS